jgi:phytoene dehydrogenase-like protein
LNPQQTFLGLLPGDAAERSVRERAERFQYNLIAPLFALHVALAEPPRYAAIERHPELQGAFLVILGLESVRQFDAMVEAHERGAPPPLVAWGACPTLFDPTQTPPGRHAAFLWQKAPYALAGDPASWERERERQARALLDLWRGYAPNLTDAAILDSFTQTPVDTERSLPNMRAGDLLVGSFAGGQMGWGRPFPGAGGYRAPVPGLYLCGGSTHPGGNITGLCGYNAAAVVARDLGLDPWWRPPSFEEALAGRGGG